MNITHLTAARNPIAPDPANPNFPFTSEQLTKLCNYSSNSYTRNLIRRKYIEGLDFTVEGGQMRLSAKCFTFFLVLGRSKYGHRFELYPHINVMLPHLQELARLQSAVSADRRQNRLKRKCPGQLTLDLIQ